MSSIPTLTTTAVSADKGAVSWGAVIAGAIGAAALSLILILLGTGLGLAVVSPWANDGASGTAVGVGTIVWITIVQLLASVMGGYLAGRLRSRWTTVHTHEVYFRDTAHGFLAWAVATLLMATLLSTAVASLVGGGAKAAANMDATTYSVDSLMRGSASAAPLTPERTAEVTRILAKALKTGDLDSADQKYLGRLVAARSDLSQADAEQRVATTFTELKQTVDEARKASAWLALWLVISLLVGAFVASLSATFGGRLRDSSALAHI
jgi:hypothetical protein